jgi:hypothetical protein
LYAVSPLGLGGTYRDLAGELDRLDRLGITGLVVSDVFRPDGDRIPVRAFGLPEEFRALVTNAHARGMRVLPVWPRDAAGERAQDRRTRRDNAEAFVRDFGVDGFWVASAWAAPREVWMGVRNALRRAAPDVVLLAGSDASWLRDGPFDGTLDAGWARMWDDVHRGRTRSDGIRQHLERDFRIHGEASGRMRATTGAWRRGHVLDMDFARVAMCTQLLTPGIPVIRAGQEVGVEPLTTPRQLVDGDPELPPIFSRLGTLRRAHLAFRVGDMLAVKTDQSPHVFAFARRSGGDDFLVLSNLTRRILSVGVRGPMWRGRSGLDLDTQAPVQVGERHPLVLPALSVRVIELGPA